MEVQVKGTPFVTGQLLRGAVPSTEDSDIVGGGGSWIW